MKTIQLCLSMLSCLTVLEGCATDPALAPVPDGGTDAHPDGTAGDGPGTDVASDVATTEAGPVPQRVLVTSQNASTSELIAVDVATGLVDGRITYPGFGTTDAHSSLFPFVLEQENNLVGRLDPARPWIIDSSWNVLLKDAIDGGYAYTDPYAAVVGAADKTYVLRYNRNEIAVLDASQKVDGGPPTFHAIDLSSLVQPNGDGAVEMTGGVYVAATKRLYVVLGNLNQNTYTDGDLLCTGTVSTVIAIDTTSDALVDLHGTGPGGAIALKGFNPAFNGIIYDPSGGGRILIDEAGCNTPPATADAGPGAITKRGVEEVKLSDLSTTMLLDTTPASVFPAGSGYPSGFVYISPTEAVLGFDFTGTEVYTWDPTTTTLGKLIPNAPDEFTYDGAGNLLGAATTEDDAGSTTNVVKVVIATGKSTTLAVNPFEPAGGTIGGVDVWPHP